MAYNPYDKTSVYERRIKELETIIDNKNSRISELQNRYDDMFRHFSNRCYKFAWGTLCDFCGYRYECKHWKGGKKDAEEHV